MVTEHSTEKARRAEAVSLVLEREWHEQVCACDSWSPTNEAPQRGCISNMTAPGYWAVEQVLAAADSMSSLPSVNPDGGDE